MSGRFLTILIAMASWIAMPDGSPEPARNVDLVRVVKSQRRLELLSQGEVVRRYTIALGGNPVGHKRFEGDQRTPEGRYVLDWRNDKSCCVRSLHISYPNEADVATAAKLASRPAA
jgi:murein L,D-transpeptidase YafK